MSYQKYPIYVYDEPAIYKDFKGGINFDSDTNNLLDNELRDAVNLSYQHTTLVKRKGASKLCQLMTTRYFNLFQGVFLFTAKSSENKIANATYDTFIIYAGDGRLQYGYYQNEINIELKDLPIKSKTNLSLVNPLNQFYDIEECSQEKTWDTMHDGYILNKDDTKQLIFQNIKKIDAVSFDDKLFIATGTRIVEVVVTDDFELEAYVVEPYLPNGIEYINYGPNRLSPLPDLCMNRKSLGAYTQIKNVLPNPIFKKQNGSDEIIGIKVETSMIYSEGADESNYHFKWEKYVADEDGNYKWVPIYNFKDNSLARHYINITTKTDLPENDYVFIESYDTKIRCTFTKDFEKESSKQDGQEELGFVLIDNDYIPDRLSGGEYGSFTLNKIDFDSFNTYNDRWKVVQTCTKILSDGNKMLFYDDAFNTGEWFKTVIGNPYYITDRGCLKFSTTKNERIIKAIHFKGVIVVFSYNELVGGNISLVSGNGDDYTQDPRYSPYVRKIVNTEISCDCAETVQIAENILFFKYKNTVYAIQGSDLSSEIISVYSMNDKLKNSTETDIPWDEPCISEITEDYYGLIFKAKLDYSSGNSVVVRPAMRLKMYYKIGQNVDGKIFFPWLRDECDCFNANATVTINNEPLLLYKNELITFNKNQYQDNGEDYKVSIKLKAYDLNYPKLSKFIKNVMLGYQNGPNSDIHVNLKVLNEAKNVLVQYNDKLELQDLKKSNANDITGVVGDVFSNTKVYRPEFAFQLLQATAEIEVINSDSFSLNSITFTYSTTDTPECTPFDDYSSIIDESTPIRDRTLNTDEISVRKQDGYKVNEDIKDQVKTVKASYRDVIVHPDPGCNLLKVIIEPADPEIKSINIGTEPIEVVPEEGHMIARAVVNPTPAQPIHITASAEEQNLFPPEGEHFSNAVVNPLPIEDKEVNPMFSNGDQLVESSEGKFMSSVTINKPEALIPENIKEGVGVAGVFGTFNPLNDGEVNPYKDINFIDYDGTLLYSYTFDEFQTLTELPPAPDHSDKELVFQEWNWTFEDLKLEDDTMYVGAIYTTADGYIHANLDIHKDEYIWVKFYINYSSAYGYVHWGDGNKSYFRDRYIAVSHKYESEGNYTIKIESNNYDKVWLSKYGAFIFSNSTKISNSKDLNYLAIPETIYQPCYVSSNPNGFYFVHSMIVPKDITNLDNFFNPNNNTYNYAPGIKTFNIPSGVTSIHYKAWIYHPQLELLSLPKTTTILNVTSDLKYVNTKYCEYITISGASSKHLKHLNILNAESITIPDSIKMNLKEVVNFDHCKTFSFTKYLSIKELDLKSSDTDRLSISSFYRSNLVDLSLPDTITKGYYDKIGTESYKLKRLRLPKNLTSLGNYFFSTCKKLEEIIMPECAITKMGTKVFFNCNIESMILPNGTTCIGSYFCDECFNLKHIYIPNTVPKVYAFRRCRNLSIVEFQDSNDDLPLELYAFEGARIIELTLPKRLSIFHWECECLYNVEKLFLKSEIPPQLIKDSNVSVTAMPQLKIYVPKGCSDTYKNDPNWSYFASKIYEEE